MAISVDTPEGTSLLSDGKTWVIDDSGRLHIRGESGNLASYNHHTWLQVSHAPDGTQATKHEGVQIHYGPEQVAKMANEGNKRLRH